jgi:hypothetical protein
LCQPPPQPVGLDEVGERARSVDLDNRQTLPVALLELRVAADVDFLQLEWLLGPHGLEHTPRRRAQVAVRSVVEDDVSYG